ncbi:MAG: hypothetical protein AAF806_23445 [Bacteroidota bacterium]
MSTISPTIKGLLISIAILLGIAFALRVFKNQNQRLLLQQNSYDSLLTQYQQIQNQLQQSKEQVQYFEKQAQDQKKLVQQLKKQQAQRMHAIKVLPKGWTEKCTI